MVFKGAIEIKELYKLYMYEKEYKKMSAQNCFINCICGTTNNVIMNFESVKFVIHKNDIHNLT